MSSISRRLALLFVVLLCAARIASAQAPITGTPPFGSFAGGPDVIDLANLNAHLDIPFANKPGRGTNFTYDMTYDSSVWYPAGSVGNKLWQPAFNWGWIAQTAITTGFISYIRINI